MQLRVWLLAIAVGITVSLARAEESIESCLQESEVRVDFASDDDTRSMPAKSLAIPAVWGLADKSVALLREMMAGRRKPLTVYVSGERASAHEEFYRLQNDLPNLIIQPMDLPFLGIIGVVQDDSCMVHAFVPRSPAESAGLRKGDAIVKVDDTRIECFAMLPQTLRRFLPGDAVEILFGGAREDRIAKEDVQRTVTLAEFARLLRRAVPVETDPISGWFAAKRPICGLKPAKQLRSSRRQFVCLRRTTLSTAAFTSKVAFVSCRANQNAGEELAIIDDLWEC